MVQDVHQWKATSMNRAEQRQQFEQLELFLEECRQKREENEEARSVVHLPEKRKPLDPWPKHMRFD